MKELGWALVKTEVCMCRQRTMGFIALRGWSLCPRKRSDFADFQRKLKAHSKCLFVYFGSWGVLFLFLWLIKVWSWKSNWASEIGSLEKVQRMSREGEGEGAGRGRPVPRACLSLGSLCGCWMGPAESCPPGCLSFLPLPFFPTKSGHRGPAPDIEPCPLPSWLQPWAAGKF